MYGELGRYPLYVRRYISIVKYWFKIVQTDNIILKTVYSKGVNWVTNLKELLNEYDCQNVFENPSSVCVKTYMWIKNKICIFILTKVFNALQISPLWDMYKIYKVSHKYEGYLNIIPLLLRCYFTRLRLSLHPLRIQKGQ